MKLLKFSIFFIFFAITDIFAEDIKIIELHPFDNDGEYSNDEILNQEEVVNDALFNTDKEENNNSQLQNDISEEKLNPEKQNHLKIQE